MDIGHSSIILVRTKTGGYRYYSTYHSECSVYEIYNLTTEKCQVHHNATA